MNRRNFLRNSTAASLPLIVPSHIFGKPGKPGANDRLNIGVIGTGGRASWLMGYSELNSQVVAVADCYLKRVKEAAAKTPGSEKWRIYQDPRQMLSKEKLDAVFVETPTHSRVWCAVQALMAGVDVYAEKPLSLTVAEGRTLVKVARKYNRVMTTGTQQRSMPINMYASKLVREGAIGKVHTVIACNYESGKKWVPRPVEPLPSDLNWDLWSNQTELRPYCEHLRRSWATYWDYDGGGQSWGVSGWGTHGLDQVQAALGASETGPVEMWTEEPGEQARVIMRYANGTLLKLEQPKIKDHAQLGAIFVGDKGKIQILRGNFIADPVELYQGAPAMTPEGKGEDLPHLLNFFDCVRSRKKPNADVEIGHRSNSVCHLVNITRQVGHKLQWDPQAEKFVGDEQANKLLSRPRRKGYELPQIA